MAEHVQVQLINSSVTEDRVQSLLTTTTDHFNYNGHRTVGAMTTDALQIAHRPPQRGGMD